MKVHVQAELETKKKEQSIIRQLTTWFQEHALRPPHRKITVLCSPVRGHASKIGIKSYMKRWGSCHIDGRIYFSWRITMAPHFVVDYVVAHELYHFVQHNHSTAFPNLVVSLMPDCRAVKN